MADFGEERFSNKYQTKVGWFANEKLHKNSKELLSIIQNFCELDNKSKVFELGGAGARNLHYIHEHFGMDKIFCSDLYREESLENMSDEMKEICVFFEGDSQDVIDNNINHSIPFKDIDLFLVVDHFMHLEYEKTDYIIKKLLSDWKPRYIMLREIRKEYENKRHPRLFHDYDQFLSDYDLLKETKSEQDEQYFIWLLERKIND